VVYSLLCFTRGWHYGYQSFQKVGADTFIAVSPRGNILFTCDAEASNQFLRGSAFGKPAELLGILNVFGPTMTGTDGQETRIYRNVAKPFFTEQTMQQVWRNSVHGAALLLEVLTQGKAAEYHKDLRPILARLTLHLLNSVCFEKDKDCLDELQFSEEVLPGHEISYSAAMHKMLDHFGTIFFTPPFILSMLKGP
jgi:hypothetical protein